MRAFLVGLSLLSLIVACARNPVTGRRELVLISESQEIALGRDTDPAIRAEFGVVADTAVQSYVESIGRRLAAVSHRPALEWHFTVVDSPVVNAFAVPGGFVYFTRGILAYMNTEGEVAGVMGHEITHVTARHSVQQLTRAQLAQLGVGVGSALSPAFGQFGAIAEGALSLLFLRHSRDAEREADRVGVEYSARASYDPREISGFFEVLQSLSSAEDRATIPGWLSTHPDPGERVQATLAEGQQWIEQLGLTPDRMTINRDGHLRNIDGMIYGDNPREGFMEGARFFHPDLQFQLLFPQQWEVENTRSAVFAFDPGGNAQMQLRLAEAPQGTSPQEYVRQLGLRGLSPQTGDYRTINGNPAFLGIYAIPVEGGTIPAVAGFIQYGQRLYEMLGVASDFARFRPVMESVVLSFDRVTDRRILDVQPDRLTIYTARDGETIDMLARRTNNPRVSAATLATLNRLAANQPIPPGRMVKLVQPGY